MPLRHQPMDKDDWLRIIRRSDLPFTTKSIAVYLAIFADQDGSRVRPGEERAAGELDLTTRCVREHMDLLRSLGLIERVNRGTAVRGRADVYQLTVPGADHPPIPMRFDPDGARIVPQRPVRKRAKKAAEPVAEDGVTGTGVPVTDALTGTPDPVDNPVTGTGVPVDNETSRNVGSGNPDWLAPTYRNPGSDLPEPLSTVTGTGVPPTNQTNHDHPTKPLGSPQATNSPEAPQTIKIDPDGVPEPTEPPAVDSGEYTIAAEILRAVPNIQPWLDAAVANLTAAGIRDPTAQLIACRAAELFQRPEGPS